MKAGTMTKLSGSVRVPGRARGSRPARAAGRARRRPGLAGLAAGGTALAASAALALAGGAPVAASAATSGPAAQAAGATKPAAPQVRVNQVGYAPRSPKVAFAMLAKPVKAVRYTITGPRNVTLWGQSTTDTGRWSSRYGAVYKLDFSQLTEPGRYRIRIDAAGQTAVSPAFEIAPSADLYHRLVLNAVRYFTSERDGGDVVHSVLNRQPANLTDRRATVYATPRYDSNDNLLGKFRKIAGPADVSGGWFDAGGGYEKFAYTGSYTEGLMLLAARDYPGQYRTLSGEAGFGLSWLEKLWNPARKVMYVQVGIGNGNASNTIQGDYNFWFLPQREDRLRVKKGGNPGPTARYVKYRPVFEAAAPGHLIDPDFAGRFAADFALAAQIAARGHSRAGRAKAEHLLALARGVYAMAKTSHIGQLVTAFPHDYYPGSQWKSDMLWGGAEITLAEQALHAPRHEVQAAYDTASRWAAAYLAQGHPVGGDTLNLYDTGAIAEADFLQATNHVWTGFKPGTILTDLARQLQVGEDWARHDPFELGTDMGPSDAAPHAFGLYITNALYQRYGGSGKYQAFAQQQLNFALGGNPWGTTFVVGAGSTFPHCMQSEIANLAGSLTGRGAIQLGAATDGPSSAGNFVGLGTVSGMRKCSAGNFKPFNTKTVGYEDNVVSWPSVEPADDYTADSLLAFALAAGDHGHRHRR
jgi:endoglucanase